MKWGKVEYKQLKALQERLQKMRTADMDKFCRDASKMLAARLLALVIKATPVGVYPEETGKKGGTLRRGWTGGKSAAGATYAKNLPVTKVGHTYIIEVINPVEYASYVEFGHRQTPGRYVPAIGKCLKAAWVNGRYFLTISEQKLEQIAPGVLQKELDKFLKEAFNGKN